MQPLCRNFNSAYSTSLPATLSNTPASLPNVRFSQEQPAPKTPVPVEVKGFSQKTTNTLLVVFGSMVFLGMVVPPLGILLPSGMGALILADMLNPTGTLGGGIRGVAERLFARKFDSQPKENGDS